MKKPKYPPKSYQHLAGNYKKPIIVISGLGELLVHPRVIGSNRRLQSCFDSEFLGCRPLSHVSTDLSEIMIDGDFAGVCPLSH